MSTDVQPELPKKKPSVLWWVAGVLFLLIALFFIQLFGPNPPIVVSPQTTYITGPLADDGLPDYEAHILEMYRDGVTPENNAAALLLQVFWPDEYNANQHQMICDELGLAQIPSKEDAIKPHAGQENRQRIRDWFSEQGITGSDDDAYNVIDEAMDHPWTSEQLPPLADWIRENEEPIEMIVEASGRPRFYSPSPSLLDHDSEMLVAMLLPGIQATREAARVLSLRAMWNLGEGRTDEAWRDIQALHRLARLVGQGHTLVEQLVAIAIEGMAIQRTVVFLDEAKLTPEQAQRIQRELSTIPNFDGMIHSLDELERQSCLDAIVYLAADPETSLDSLTATGQGSLGFNLLHTISVDWNVVLRETNQCYDRLVAAAKVPIWTNREKALDQFELELNQKVSQLQQPGRWVAGVLTRGQRSEMVASAMLGFFVPALRACSEAQDRVNAEIDLMKLAAALAVYRAEQGEYPETLDSLVPDVLPKLPVDLHQAKPFVYRRDGTGYLLYSTGANGLDDGGSNDRMSILEGRNLNDVDPAEHKKLLEKIPAGADDFSIRVPTPPFELPKPPADE